ncbi:MAG: hypothetical protein GXY14_00660 [Spirochaetes bacterium]|nr:hypothetical protein [Spirochaetota bacterium]
MKRTFKIFTGIILIVMAAAGIGTSSEFDDLQVKPLTLGRIQMLPVPKDNRNYFFLQAIGNDTIIIIGDFTTLDKRIVYILDKGADNTIDKVVDYYPLYKRMHVRKESDSRFWNKDIVQLKKDIIAGTVYKNNFTDYMYSMQELETIVKSWDEIAIGSDVYGFNVMYRDIDEVNKIAGQFAYGKRAGGYYLQFATNFYKVRIVGEEYPILKYSVYCKNTNDPVVKETVENLFKYNQPLSARTNK